MLRNYILIGIRNLVRHKFFALINLAGLAVGFTSFLLIMLFVFDEISYDKFYLNYDQVYRIAGSYHQGGDERNRSAQTSYMLNTMISGSSPAIQEVVRLMSTNPIVGNKEEFLKEDNVFHVDSNFFKVFQVPLLKGNVNTALDGPNKMVVTTEMAEKYFSNTDVIGKTLKINDIDVTISGIIEPFPDQAHFHPNFLISIKTFASTYPRWVLNNFSGTSHITYILIRDGYTPGQVNDYLAEVAKVNWDNPDGRPLYFLQPIKDIHLYSDLNGELEPNGSITYVYIFILIAVFILILAVINYINLSTAMSLRRAKEVGVRRVMGGVRHQLIWQFLIESIIITLLAVILAGVLTELLLPLFNQLSGKHIDQYWILSFQNIAALIGFGIILGILAGFYPAIYTTSFTSLHVLKNKVISIKTGSAFIRKFLVFLQFSISLALIIGTLLVNRQLNYLHNKDLGINTSYLISVPLPRGSASETFKTLKDQLSSESRIVNATASNNSLTSRIGHWRGYQPEGREELMIPTIIVDPGFINTVQAEIIEGRDFSEDIISDKMEAYIVNESAADLIGFEKTIDSGIKGAIFTGSEWRLRMPKL